MVQRFEGHAGGERTVADDGHRTAVFPPLGGRDGHPQRGADRSARMADTESVVFAFGPCRKRCQALGLLDGMQPPAAAGEDLVRVGLVSHIPYQPVERRIEYVVERDGQLYRAEAGGEVTAARAHALDQELA